MQAIETVFDGYRFRSRLEARWAVFFDTLSIRYEYEKEGFDLDDAGWYLPDFWLPELKYWIEVKPNPPNDVEQQKAMRLALASHHPVFFHLAIPWMLRPEEVMPGLFLPSVLHPTLWGFTPFLHENTSQCIFDGGALLWTRCPLCQKLGISLWGANDCLPCKCIPFDGTLSKQYSEWKFNAEHPSLLKAYTAARQARFEHEKRPTYRNVRKSVQQKVFSERMPAFRPGSSVLHSIRAQGKAQSSKVKYSDEWLDKFLAKLKETPEYEDEEDE